MQSSCHALSSALQSQHVTRCTYPGSKFPRHRIKELLLLAQQPFAGSSPPKALHATPSHLLATVLKMNRLSCPPWGLLARRA